MQHPLWTPSVEQINRSNLARFTEFVNHNLDRQLPLDYTALYDWSINHPGEFWQAIWDFSGVRASQRGEIGRAHV